MHSITFLLFLLCFFAQKSQNKLPNVFIAFLTYGFKGCDAVFLKNFFLICPIFVGIFVVVCDILGNKRSQWPPKDIKMKSMNNVGIHLMVSMIFKLFFYSKKESILQLFPFCSGFCIFFTYFTISYHCRNSAILMRGFDKFSLNQTIISRFVKRFDPCL